MENFKITRKGYDRAQVEEYISRAEKQRQSVITEQAMRIEELKAQLFRAEKEIDGYRARENSVNEALLSAIEKANEIDGTTKIRFALEGERIKIFEEKWTSYCKKTMQTLKVKNDMCKFLDGVDAEISEIMYRDLNVPSAKTEPAEQYAAEKSRLSKKAGRIAAEHKDHIGDEENIFTYDPYEAKSNEKTGDAEAFNLDDLDNPPTLADLCKQLGL